MYLVSAYCADEDYKWRRYKEFSTLDEAKVFILELKSKEYCYLVELWKNPECHHAIG